MKGKVTHGFPLSPPVVELLRKMKASVPERHRDVPWVFQWKGKRPADCNGQAFKDAVKAAKLGPLRWHDLRHTWASWAIQAGGTLQQVMQLGGWKSLTMVMRYAHLAPDHLAEAASLVTLTGQKPAQKKTARKRVSRSSRK
jgi:integrase